MLQIYVVTRASAVDKTEDQYFQPRRSPRKHSSDRGCDNRAAARASSSSSFGACFDRSAFEHPPPEVDIEYMPPASKPNVGSDAEDLVKIWDDVVERALSHSSRATSKRGGGATSAADGAAASEAGGAATSAAGRAAASKSGGAATSAAGGAATSAAGGAATSAAGRAAASASGGAATSAAGGAASPGHQSLDSSDGWPFFWGALSDSGSPKKLQEDRKSNTLMGSELVEDIIRQRQLSREQVASMAVPIIIREAGMLLRAFPGG